MRETLGDKVLRESVWLFGSYALSRFGRVVMMLALAAFLTPQEYGIIGLSAVIISAAQLINECIWPAIVHRDKLSERFLSTAFTANIIIAFTLAVGIFLAAPWIARFYGDPVMTGVLRVIALGLIPDGFFCVPDSLLRKKLSFRSRALPEIAGTLVAGAVTIILLLLGIGVLSYAIGFVVDRLVMCILTIRKVSWRPSFGVSWSSLREIVAYSKHILGGDLGRHFSSNIDYLIVGRVLGAGPLGFYSLAFNLANYPVTNFALVLSRIVFPTFAALRDDLPYARRTYLKMIKLSTALVAPLLVMLALLAPLVIAVLLGEKWQPSVLPLQIMVIAGISRTISYPSVDMLRAWGLPNIPFKIGLLEGLVILGALLLLAGRGIETVALTTAIVLSVTAWTTTAITCRTFGISFQTLGRVLVPGVALATSGAVPILSLKLLGLSTLPDILELIVLISASLLGMVACLATVCRRLLHEIVALVPSLEAKLNRK